MAVPGQSFDLDQALDKAYDEIPLSKAEILGLLNLTGRAEIEQVFEAARALRRRYFGTEVFLYGFVYFSTYCRNDCAFCYYRKSNQGTVRYRKETGEIVDTACKLAESGVHLVDLTMGEDPEYFLEKRTGFEGLVQIAEQVKKATKLPLMASPGVVPDQVLVELKKAGVDWYACYQETHNRTLYSKLRLKQSYDERLRKKKFARQLGLLIEEGLLTGVGDSPEDIVVSLQVMKLLGAHQIRVMSFVPQKGTPMYKEEPVSRLRELLIIAVMRLLFPERLIPASLDVDGIVGLKQRLDAGANVVTSIIPPQAGLLGVSQSSLDIEEGYRSVNGVLPVLQACGLAPASLERYVSWLEKQRQQSLNSKKAGAKGCE
ncbi:methylornithine synthase PylB [Zhaonella formicivorans]|uniref:methylornithine synthase PylB n=1 Tax=Zhaonella formicivorans TaxID=2528593 RepID=UPI0010E6B73C|nr:methylornithine synthase PylB [Zhaonella formicivorans]